jgi:hypothetical protein
MLWTTSIRQLPSTTRTTGSLLQLAALGLIGLHAGASVTTTPTMDPDVLRTALNPVGLTIDSVSIVNGVDGQFGTFSNFELLPVSIRPGIVLSSGNVANLAPIPGATDPAYEPSSPPEQVNSQMNPELSGGTAEFDAYGAAAGNIENFTASYDVAALRVDFTLDAESPVKFDFIFGSVEFPAWTSQFTDSFLVFLDGTDPQNQVTVDTGGNAVQVGSSFAGLETIDDQNTAFSNPHGLIHHLTTTTAMLSAGHHTLYFEVGDVNDHILDSAVFIANLRAEAGNEGTDPTDDDHGGTGCAHITDEPQSVSTCLSDTADFSVSATGDGPLQFRWRKDHHTIDADLNPTAEEDTLELSDLTVADIGTYDCVVTNHCGSVISDPVTLSICIGDFNCDGGVDGSDIGSFFTSWESGEAAADVNGDGGVDGADVSTFFEHWEGGC